MVGYGKEVQWPIEIEAKMSVPDLDVVRARLRELGATPLGSVLETNTFFDTEDRSLLAADEGLRLRKRVDVEYERDEVHHHVQRPAPARAAEEPR